MSLKKNKDLKLYFSISEVAQMFDVNESTLRFWEKEFDIINPRKTSKGTRFYKQEDIDAVRLIYHLVKERGMTLAGARQKLKDNKETTIRQEEILALIPDSLTGQTDIKEYLPENGKKTLTRPVFSVILYKPL